MFKLIKDTLIFDEDLPSEITMQNRHEVLTLSSGDIEFSFGKHTGKFTEVAPMMFFNDLLTTIYNMEIRQVSETTFFSPETYEDWKITSSSDDYIISSTEHTHTRRLGKSELLGCLVSEMSFLAKLYSERYGNIPNLLAATHSIFFFD